MREKLAKAQNQRMRFKAKVKRFGQKKGWQGEMIQTLLLVDVVAVRNSEIQTDHIWMTAGKWSQEIQEGDSISFDARITEYEKGYFGYKDDVFKPIYNDFRLERPTKVIIDKKR